MGWYIRKALARGPIRFNLSKGGIGLSVGVKGARIGICPRGTYVHFGRGGLYYRQYLHAPAEAKRAEQLPAGETHPSLDEYGNDVLPTITQTSSASELVTQLQEKQPAPIAFPIVFLTGIVVAIVSYSLATWSTMLISIGIAIIFGLLSLPRPKTMVVMYDLEPEIESALSRVHQGLEAVGQCSRLWLQHSTGTAEWKRNAGANSLVKRQPASLVLDDQSLFKANVPIPKLQSAGLELWFLPDQGILRISGRLISVDYSATSATSSVVRFVESDALPPDTQVVGQTWQYVNRSGGPDRRFKNNKQLPIALYGQTVLSAQSGWSMELSVSRAPCGDIFAACWKTLQVSHAVVKAEISPGLSTT